MVDFGSKLTSYVKNEAQTVVDKTVNDITGKLSGIGGNVINSLIGSVSKGLGQNLFNIGAAFDTISAVASQKVDGIVSGGAPEYTSGGKCADRSTVADLSKLRNPTGGSLKDYNLNVFPETKIETAISKSTDTNMVVLTEQSDKYYMKFRVYRYERDDLFKPASKDSFLYSVDLPLPLELLESYSTEFSTQNMKHIGNLLNGNIGEGTAMAAAGDLIRNAPAILGGIGDGKGIIGNQASRWKSVEGSVGQAVGGSAASLGLDLKSIMNAVEQYIGVAPNPNPSYMFEGPRLRDFTFSWIFNPKNAEESKRLKKAIQKLKSSSLPTSSFGVDTGVLNYPHVLMTNFYPWDKGSNVSDGPYGWTDSSIMRLKRCVIANISTNYAPTGAPSFFAGTHEPVFIQMTIALKEIEFVIGEDIDSSNVYARDSGTIIDDISNKVGSIATQVGEGIYNAVNQQ